MDRQAPHRVEQFQQVLKRNNVSAAVLRLPENIVLFSGYWPRNGFSFVWIPAEGEACLIVPHGDAKEAGAGRVRDVRAFGWVRLTDGNPYDIIAKTLADLQLRDKVSYGARIAVDNDFDTVAPPLCAGETSLPGTTTLRNLKRALQTDQFVPCAKMIQEVRITKTRADVEKLQVANRVAKQGLLRFRDLIAAPGLSEIEIAAEVESTIAKTASQSGAAYGRAWAQVSSGVATADAYLPGMISSSRVVQSGDFVMIELATVVDGYWSDLTRTSAVGAEDAKQREVLHIVSEAQRAAISAVHSGAVAGDVDAVARKIITDAGYGDYFVHHTGHGLGFSYHESAPYVGPGSPAVLQRGTVHSVEPGIYIPGWGGVRIEDNVVVTDQGCIVLGGDELDENGTNQLEEEI